MNEGDHVPSWSVQLSNQFGVGRLGGVTKVGVGEERERERETTFRLSLTMYSATPQRRGTHDVSANESTGSAKRAGRGGTGISAHSREIMD